MFVVMGGTGHVGSAVAEALLDRKEHVAIITRDAAGADAWQDRDVELIEADVDDVESLHAAFRRGTRAFLLNPPADPSTDTDATERASASAIVAALEDSGLEKVVVQSVSGAQPGERIGDLTVLWGLEQALAAQPIPVAINRGGYFLSNWDDLLEPARQGTLPTMLTADRKLPMVAPRDLGLAAAERLLSSVEDVGIRDVEGPERYSPDDVAAAFARALGRDVEVQVAPRDTWRELFRGMGFSEPAADAYARMTEVTVDAGDQETDDPWRGPTTLDDYIAQLVSRS